MSAADAPSSNGRILIIEDNRDLADNIAECLSDEGYTPFVTASAAQIDTGIAALAATIRAAQQA